MSEYFEAFFTEVSLAHWIMGDGYWENFDSTVFICTECFTLTEVHMLKNLLDKKYGLKTGLKIRKNKTSLVGYRLRFSRKKENLLKLQELIAPFMHPSMLYKIGKNV